VVVAQEGVGGFIMGTKQGLLLNDVSISLGVGGVGGLFEPGVRIFYSV
jgi:hypothetical protein